MTQLEAATALETAAHLLVAAANLKKTNRVKQADDLVDQARGLIAMSLLVEEQPVTV